MDRPYWQQQTTTKPLFPDLLWSQPQNRLQAGKLLIIGGSSYSFAAPAAAWSEALRMGIGRARVLLPDCLEKTLGKTIEDAHFLPSTPSGSFSQLGLGQILDSCAWADGILLVGNFGKNSETAIVLEKLITKYSGQLSVCGDAVDYFLNDPLAILERTLTTLVCDQGQLQKLAVAAKFEIAFTSTMSLMHLVVALHQFSDRYLTNIVLADGDQLLVAAAGQVSSTPNQSKSNKPQLAAGTAVWWLQNPGQAFAAISSALISRQTI
ncbi:MAG TPA: hypothetical protein VNE40_03865 [Candidatus Dormibacteraeota bacterium]|nr:hypothetical protein [Candidatus Dormibacteraeota bacterium]